MRIIRTLSESDSGEQREEQKRRLQNQFRESDQLVDQLVFQKQKELSKVMQVINTKAPDSVTVPEYTIT